MWAGQTPILVRGPSLVQGSRFVAVGIGSEQRWKMPVRAAQSRAA